MKLNREAKITEADDLCEACGKNVSTRECDHGILCERCDAEVHGAAGGRCGEKRMKIVTLAFSTTEYELSHGKKPRGFGCWAFALARNPRIDSIFYYTGTLAEAKAAAKKNFVDRLMADDAYSGTLEVAAYVLP